MQRIQKGKKLLAFITILNRHSQTWKHMCKHARKQMLQSHLKMLTFKCDWGLIVLIKHQFQNTLLDLYPLNSMLSVPVDVSFLSLALTECSMVYRGKLIHLSGMERWNNLCREVAKWLESQKDLQIVNFFTLWNIQYAQRFVLLHRIIQYRN